MLHTAGNEMSRRLVSLRLLSNLVRISWILPGHVEHVSDFLRQADASTAVGCDVKARDAALSCHF